MYQVFIDGKDFYYPGDEEYTVSEPVVKLQLNDSGTFECGVPVLNPEYTAIKNRISMIQVLKNGKELFYGEVRESEKDFYGTKQVYAVGELAFLFDSIQPRRHIMTGPPGSFWKPGSISITVRWRKRNASMWG